MRSKLSRKSGFRKRTVANLTTDLILYGRITTTKSKAKTVQSYVEKVFTLAKKNTLAAKREVGRRVNSKLAVKKIFDLSVRPLQKYSGGYTRVYNKNFRRGDSAPMAMIEVIPDLFSPPEETKDKPTKNKPKNKS